MFNGLMQDAPLTLHVILRRAQELFPSKLVYTNTPTGFVSTNYEELGRRVTRLAAALRKLGIRPGDRVATFAWNSQRHLELSLAVPCMGAVLHTVNVRLSPTAIGQIIAEAEDRIIFVDVSLLAAWQVINPSVEPPTLVVMNDDSTSNTPTSEKCLDYEELLRSASNSFVWPNIDENAAAGMCFTSGTTGKPKGVVYSHRSTVLHSLSLLLADGIALRENDICMPVVPQYHANAWGFTYAALLAGSSLAFAGRSSQPDVLASTIEAARVTVATAVPTVWHNLLEAVDSGDIDPKRLSSLERLPVGGAAVSERLIDKFAELDIRVMHCWGMTETSPLGTVNGYVKSSLPRSAERRTRLAQGLPLPLCRTRLVGDAGQSVPHNGNAVGELQISGPWVASAYYDKTTASGASANTDSFAVDETGTQWLKTGDMAVVDAAGYIYLVDRSKDLIKSGGEWISSMQLELRLMNHPDVTEAAVVTRPDPKWDERPVAFVIPGTPEITAEELNRYLGRDFSRNGNFRTRCSL